MDQDDANEILEGMAEVDFVCERPLVGYVTAEEAKENIKFLLQDKKQKDKDMFALCLSRRVFIKIGSYLVSDTEWFKDHYHYDVRICHSSNRDEVRKRETVWARTGSRDLLTRIVSWNNRLTNQRAIYF